MFGGGAFGEFAFCDFEYELDSSEFVEFLERVRAPRCFVLELGAFSLAETSGASAAFGAHGFAEAAFAESDADIEGGVVSLYYATHGYNTQAADTPAATHFSGRLGPAIRIGRQIAGRDGIGGLARVYAEIQLDNPDGALDLLDEQYSLPGRSARIYLGDPAAAFSTFGLVFSGIVQSVTTGNTVTMTLSDGLRKLDRAINETAYAGTGGNEGGDDLKGKRKPKCYGAAFNVTPPLVDAVSLVYQVNDGAINDVPSVRDRGIRLTKVGGAPGAGQYQVNASAGTFTLGATPDGQVTCDVEGDASGAGYVERTGDIVNRILREDAELSSGEIDPASLDNLNSVAAAPVGIWIGTEPVSCGAVLDELLAGVGAYGGFSRQGAFNVGMVALAFGPADAVYTDVDVLAPGITRLPLPALVEPIVWRTVVAYQRNYTVQEDLAAAVLAADKTFAAEEVRVVEDEEATIQERHLIAREYLGLEGLYSEEADAEDEVARRKALWGVRRGLYDVPLPAKALVRDLGDVVSIEHSRHGFEAGVDGRVLGYEANGARVTLRVLV